MMGCSCDAGTEVVYDENDDPIKERCPTCGNVFVDFPARPGERGGDE